MLTEQLNTIHDIQNINYQHQLLPLYALYDAWFIYVMCNSDCTAEPYHFTDYNDPMPFNKAIQSCMNGKGE